MAAFVLALVGQEGEEPLKCVLMDTGGQSVTMDGIVEMLMLCVDSWDSQHIWSYPKNIILFWSRDWTSIAELVFMSWH